MATPDEIPDPPPSFDEFLIGMEPRLKKLLTTYRIPAEDAEDVLQQTLLALLYQWDRVRDPENWLLGTLRRHCMVYWRNSRRKIYAAVDSTVLEFLSEPVASSQEKADMLCDLDNLLGRLPSRCRSLLQLRFRMGYEAPEIARRLGYQASSIGKITIRCLAALSRELLAAGLSGAEPEAALRALDRG
ncbi:MAG: RNA polymerase sigma factor [Thermoanaerobaculia bacterium]